jgi:small subunit ribosomal protein S20
MANHKSAVKRVKQNEQRRTLNKYQAKSTRNAIKTLRNTSDKAAAEELYPKITAMLDKLAKNKVVHKNKAANLKSKLAKHVNSL